MAKGQNVVYNFIHVPVLVGDLLVYTASPISFSTHSLCLVDLLVREPLARLEILLLERRI